MINILYIALGSALGGVLRYAVGRLFPSWSLFPWSTFVVNIVGCFIIGLIYGLIDRGVGMSEHTRLFLTVGFCGGFTTFSTFAHENYLLFESGNFITVCLYATLSFLAGLILAYAGHAASAIFIHN